MYQNPRLETFVGKSDWRNTSRPGGGLCSNQTGILSSAPITQALGTPIISDGGKQVAATNHVNPTERVFVYMCSFVSYMLEL